MIPDVTPSVARDQLCAALIEIRAELGMTQNDVAAALEWSWSKINRIEAGVVGLSITDLKALLALYSVADADRELHLLGLARAARGASWWSDFKGVVSPAAGKQLDYERQARAIKCFHPSLVPGLLQTKAYAEELVAGQGEGADDPRKVELRIRRQGVLTLAEPPEVVILVGEAALYNRMCSPATMAEQLQVLAHNAVDGPARLGVIPFGRSVYPAMLSPFTLTELLEGETVVFNETPHSARAAKNDHELTNRYSAYFSLLHGQHAVFGAQAAALIDRALKGLDDDGR